MKLPFLRRRKAEERLTTAPRPKPEVEVRGKDVSDLDDATRAEIFRHMRSMYRIRRNAGRASTFNPRSRRRFEKHGREIQRLQATA